MYIDHLYIIQIYKYDMMLVPCGDWVRGRGLTARCH